MSPDEGGSRPFFSPPGELGWLAVCLALGAGLRFWNLGGRSLWTDELITLITVRRPLGESLLQLQDYAAPAYQLLLRLLATGPSPSEWLLRSPAALFGVLSIAAAWWLARITFGAPAAALSAALLALNPQQVYFAREARPYTLFVLAATLSMAFLYRQASASGRRPATADRVGYLVATVVLVYGHYFGFLVVAAQATWVGIGLACGQRQRMRPLLIAVAGALATGVPALWLASRFVTSGARGFEGWVPERGLMDAFVLLGEAVGTPWLGLACAVPLLSALWWTRTPFDRQRPGGKRTRDAKTRGERSAEPAPASADRAARAAWWQRRRGAVLCASWVAWGVFALALASQLYRPMLLARYLLPAAVPMTLLGAGYLLRASRGATAIVVALAVSGMLAGGPTTLAGVLGEARSRGLRELAGWLVTEADREADLLVVDWPFWEGFVNPEIEGLAYYGVPRPRIGRLTIAYPDRDRVLDPEKLAPGRRAYVLGLNLARPPVEALLERQGRRWGAGPVGVNLVLVQVEPRRR